MIPAAQPADPNRLVPPCAPRPNPVLLTTRESTTNRATPTRRRRDRIHSGAAVRSPPTAVADRHALAARRVHPGAAEHTAPVQLRGHGQRVVGASGRGDSSGGAAARGRSRRAADWSADSQAQRGQGQAQSDTVAPHPPIERHMDRHASLAAHCDCPVLPLPLRCPRVAAPLPPCQMQLRPCRSPTAAPTPGRWTTCASRTAAA